MGKEAVRIGGGDGIDGGSGGGEQSLGCAFRGGPKVLLDLGEGQLNRVEVRGVGRQEQETRPRSRHGLPGSFTLVRTEIVQDHDLPWAQAGRQNAFGIGGEGCPVDGPWHRHGRTDARGGQGGQKRDVGTVVARYATNRSCAAWGACPAPRQGGVGAGLVDEDQIRRHERGDLVPPSGTGRVIAFGRDERLFLSGQPARPSARDIVAGLTQTPVIAAHWAQCSLSVASGAARTWATRAGSASRAIRRDRPGRGEAATEPVWRCRWRHRLIVLSPTPKRRAASAWGRPASMAPTSRSRRSAEYCFIAIA